MLTLPDFGVAIPEEVAASIITWALTKRQEEEPAPPIAKTLSLLSYVQRYDYRYFVETGTFLGHTTEAVARIGSRSRLEKAYTIELSRELYDNAVRRFAGNPVIECLHGDSTDLLPPLIAGLDAPAIFWLDGHYSGGMTALGSEVTPILREIEAVLASPIKDHVILIDDVRLFGRDGYPPLSEVLDIVRAALPASRIEIYNDIARITPGG